MNAEKTGRLISELRKNKDMTQQQLAELLHVSDKAISRWETGRGLPDINSLEDIAEALDISVAEILKGERLEEPVTPEEIKEITTDGLSLARDFTVRKKFQNIFIGIFLSFILLTLFIMYMKSPIFIKDANRALTLESLSDGRLVAIMKGDVADYEVDDVTDPDTHRVYKFISCYQTRWNQITGKKSEAVVLLGHKEQLDYVYYYPTDSADQLIFANEGLPEPDGVISLPRLVYNYWIIIGIGLSIVGIAAYVLLRRKYYADKVLKAAVFPIVFTISIIAVLIGRFNEVYNAQFYFTGIVLLTAFIYILFLAVYSINKGKKSRNAKPVI